MQCSHGSRSSGPAHNTHRGHTTHPPGTMAKNMKQKREAQKLAAEEKRKQLAAAAEEKALKLAAEAAPAGEVSAALRALKWDTGAAAALAPPIARTLWETIEDTVVDDDAPTQGMIDDDEDDAPLISAEDAALRALKKGQQKALIMDTEVSGEDGQVQSPDTQSSEECPPPLPTTTPTSRSSL